MKTINFFYFLFPCFKNVIQAYLYDRSYGQWVVNILSKILNLKESNFFYNLEKLIIFCYLIKFISIRHKIRTKFFLKKEVFYFEQFLINIVGTFNITMNCI